MANERLRAALDRDRWTLPAFAEAIGVDPKTVERWITKERTPHRRIAMAAAARLSEDPAYLWPELDRRPVLDNYGEIVTVYPERNAVPNSLWLSLLRAADGTSTSLSTQAFICLRPTLPGLRKSRPGARTACGPGSRLVTRTPSRSAREARKRASVTDWPRALTTRWPGTGRCSRPRI